MVELWVVSQESGVTSQESSVLCLELRVISRRWRDGCCADVWHRRELRRIASAGWAGPLGLMTDD